MASALPTNRARFTLAELLSATGGTAHGACPSGVCGVATDTRDDLRGTAFVALRGERFDGHDYLTQAKAAGAALMVVDRDVADLPEMPVVRVSSTLVALGALAAFHRRRWGGKVAAVAGSVGKTTTRTAVRAFLSAAGVRVHGPRGNLNNRVGVPLVLLSVLESHEVAVVELGTSLPGEVALLTDMSRPDAAVLTRVAIEHAQGLGDLDDIEAEEGALMSVLDPAAVAVANGDDERCVRQLAKFAGKRRLSYGRTADDLDYAIESLEVTRQGLTRLQLRRPSGSRLLLESDLLGAPGAYALAGGIAVAEALIARPLHAEEARSAARSSELGEPGRLVRVELADGSLVLDDTYNSSPASARSSSHEARELANGRGGRLVLVLGEMRELGELAAREHERLGASVAALAPDLVVAFGGHAEDLLRGLGNTPARSHDDALSALSALQTLRQPGDVILVKASRGLRAERIVAELVDGSSLASGRVAEEPR